MDIALTNKKLSQYLELLEATEQNLKILRLERETSNPAYLIESLLRERGLEETKEMFALEYSNEEDNPSIPAKDANILARLKTAKAVGVRERRVDVVGKDLVLTSKSFIKHLADGETNKYEAYSIRKISEDLSTSRATQVKWIGEQDLLVTLEDPLTLKPMESVLDFGEDEVFLVLQHNSGTTYRVTGGKNAASKFFKNDESQEVESLDVSIRTADKNRKLIHVIEAMKQPEEVPAQPNEVQLAESPPENPSPAEVKPNISTMERALEGALKLPLDQVVICLNKRFGEAKLAYAFSNVLTDNKSPSHQPETKACLVLEKHPPSTSATLPTIATSTENGYFDPLNTPCSSSRDSPVSNRSVGNSVPAQREGTIDGNLSSKLLSDMSSMNSADFAASDRMSRQSDETELSSGTTLSAGLSSSVKTALNFEQIVEIIENALKLNERVAFIVSTPDDGYNIVARLKTHAFTATMAINSFTRSDRYCKRVEQHLAVVLPLKDWKNLSEKDRTKTGFVVNALRPNHTDPSFEEFQKSCSVVNFIKMPFVQQDVSAESKQVGKQFSQ